MAVDETVIDDGEFNMEELVTLSRAHSDHDYQLVKGLDARQAPAVGYVDLPIDEDWPPNLKKRMKQLEFDYENGRDYLPPIVKEENYENYYKIESRMKENNDIRFGDSGVLSSALLSTGRKLGELLEAFPFQVPVKNEDIVIEEVSDYDVRNITEVKNFVVNGTANEL